MPIERVVEAEAKETPEEQVLENTLRPQSFKEYIGQERLKTNLGLAIAAAKQRGESLEHVLLYGPPGLGKTTMAGVIAREMGANYRITSGPAIDRPADLASLLTSLQPNDVLFIDEIHRLHRGVEEILYSAMEDFKLDITIGKGPAGRSVRLDLPPFTLIGATTRTGALAGPLRDRFGIVHRLEYYTEPEIARIVDRSSVILGVKLEAVAAELLSTRARLTPRIANRLLKRVRDYADIHNSSVIDAPTVNAALQMLEIDEFGLDAADRAMLLTIHDKYGERPVGLTTIAALTGDEPATIEDYYEPYLMQIGFLERTPRGRKVTERAREHLGFKPDKLKMF
ncbi:Holliday junction branch migration DNA helicase RuvB [Candidatus Saccharibacteria bacterium]|nr:Holliday junction branch migration DNA helicase RuvB [Candidatus Saccharibacteria bacterium]